MKSADQKKGKAEGESTGLKKVSESSPLQDETMIYTLAHDIKSPINQVEGLLLIACRMSQDEEVKGILQMALSANRGLSAKVNELLDMNIREKSHEEFDLGELVTDLWSSVASMTASESVKLIHKCRIDHAIKADKIRVKSILQNLIENAVKYSNPENSTHSILINSFRSGDNLIIKVTDNGIGIKSSNMDKIFSASFQEDSTKNGHGMGLYLARRNAQTMGGNLEVESAYGEGTTFTLTIPYRGAAAAA